MSRYLPPRTVSGHIAVAICPRCKMKVYYGDLQTDPDTQQKLCPKCVDIADPYRSAVTPDDDVVLQYPRPDDPLIIPEE